MRSHSLLQGCHRVANLKLIEKPSNRYTDIQHDFPLDQGTDIFYEMTAEFPIYTVCE